VLGYTYDPNRREYALWRHCAAFSELIGRFGSGNAVVRAIEYLPGVSGVARRPV
jgi:hypothetical protein